MTNHPPQFRSCALRLLAALALAASAAGCPTPAVEPLPALGLPPPSTAPDGSIEITETNRAAHLYAFYVAAPGSADRAAEREALILQTLHSAQRFVQEDDALDVRTTLDGALRLFDPDELDARIDSAGLRKLLEWIEPVARRLGRPEDSLVVAEGRLLLDPDDTNAARTVEEIVEWAGRAEDEAESIERQADLLDAVTEILPSPALIKKLVGLIFERHDLGLEATPITSMEEWMIAARREQFFFSGLTLNVLRLTVRLGRPEAAIDMLEPYRGTSAYLSDVLDEVAALQDPLERADAGSDLVDALSAQFPGETQRLCTRLREDYPEDGRFSACLGRAYAGRRDWGVAARLLLEATARDPDERDFAEQAMVLLAGEIQEGMDGAPWDELQSLHQAFATVLERYRARWPQAEPPVDETAVLRLMANAALIGGDVATARTLQQAALDKLPTAQGYLEFGQMEARAGDPARARQLLDAGLAVSTGDLADRTNAQAGIREELGLLRGEAGDREGATEAFDEAIDDWKQLGRAGVLPEAQVDAKTGILLVRSGRREEGLRRIALAVREAGEDEFGPEEDALVYNEALSFLHMEGERDLLTELFPLAATRQDLDVVWRVYYALWTLGASRRDGLPDDPETVAFLGAIRASGWSGTLARFYRGELDFPSALEAARTIGQQTELRYYEALNRLAAGDRPGAEELLRQVVATNIFNYFEWEMARRTLAGLQSPGPSAATVDAQPPAASVSR